MPGQQPEIRTEDAQQFWGWFETQAAEIAEMIHHEAVGKKWRRYPVIPEVQTSMRAEIQARLHQVHPDLEMSVVHDSGRSVALLGARGELALVPLVLRMVQMAPQLPGWDIGAFMILLVNSQSAGFSAQRGNQTGKRRDASGRLWDLLHPGYHSQDIDGYGYENVL